MRVLDLFSGLGGWSRAFMERGHDIVTVDIDPKFVPTLVKDINQLTPEDLPWQPDIVLASPPCEKFSVMALGHHWLPGYEPKHEGTVVAMDLVRSTVRLIGELKPAFWVIENPVGMLRKLHLIPYERQTVTYCQYGGRTRKPTDLWGGFPPSLVLRPPCRNYSPCHLAAPRGSRTGVQGPGSSREARKGPSRQGSLENVKREAREFYGTSSTSKLAALRAEIPRDLSLVVCSAAERDLARGNRATEYTGRLFA